MNIQIIDHNEEANTRIIHLFSMGKNGAAVFESMRIEKRKTSRSKWRASFKWKRGDKGRKPVVDVTILQRANKIISDLEGR